MGESPAIQQEVITQGARCWVLRRFDCAVEADGIETFAGMWRLERRERCNRCGAWATAGRHSMEFPHCGAAMARVGAGVLTGIAKGSNAAACLTRQGWATCSSRSRDPSEDQLRGREVEVTLKGRGIATCGGFQHQPEWWTMRTL